MHLYSQGWKQSQTYSLHTGIKAEPQQSAFIPYTTSTCASWWGSADTALALDGVRLSERTLVSL
jgi:hypothetical protein